MEKTDETLLSRLRLGVANADWKTFFDRYSFAMLCYARKLGLSWNEAEDAVQETMVTLMQTLPRFVYDPQKGRFRNYVTTILHRRCLHLIRKRSRTGIPVDNDILANTEDTAHELADEHLEETWKLSLIAATWQNLCDSGTLEERTIAVFEAVAFDGKPAEDVAQQFGINTNAVYQIKHRLMRRLTVEVEKLAADFE